MVVKVIDFKATSDHGDIVKVSGDSDVTIKSDIDEIKIQVDFSRINNFGMSAAIGEVHFYTTPEAKHKRIATFVPWVVGTAHPQPEAVVLTLDNAKRPPEVTVFYYGFEVKNRDAPVSFTFGDVDPSMTVEPRPPVGGWWAAFWRWLRRLFSRG